MKQDRVAFTPQGSIVRIGAQAAQGPILRPVGAPQPAQGRGFAPITAPITAPAGGALYRRIGKRLLDIALVIATAPLSLSLIAIAALALWIEGGLPFYRQDRRGRNGATFSILKLRTMVRDADARLAEMLARDADLRIEWETTQKLKVDPRITPVGQFLRRTSLDEVPQLWNVLRGDMSLVGPRPMMTDQKEIYGNTGHYDALRPGLTGKWQVSRRNESHFIERVKLDADYNRTLSFSSDLAILVRTVGVVLRRTGY